MKSTMLRRLSDRLSSGSLSGKFGDKSTERSNSNSSFKLGNTNSELDLPAYSDEERRTVLELGCIPINYSEGYMCFYYPDLKLKLKFNSKRVCIDDRELERTESLVDIVSDVWLIIGQDGIGKNYMPEASATIVDWLMTGVQLDQTTSIKKLYILQQVFYHRSKIYIDRLSSAHNEALMIRLGASNGIDMQSQVSLEQLLAAAKIRPYPTVILDAYLYLKTQLSKHQTAVDH